MSKKIHFPNKKQKRLSKDFVEPENELEQETNELDKESEPKSEIEQKKERAKQLAREFLQIATKDKETDKNEQK